MQNIKIGINWEIARWVLVYKIKCPFPQR